MSHMRNIVMPYGYLITPIVQPTVDIGEYWEPGSSFTREKETHFLCLEETLWYLEIISSGTEPICPLPEHLSFLSLGQSEVFIRSCWPISGLHSAVSCPLVCPKDCGMTYQIIIISSWQNLDWFSLDQCPQNNRINPVTKGESNPEPIK